jgi:hypothetical protein
MDVTRVTSLPLYTIMAAAGAIVVMVAVDGLRTALLALLAGGAVAASRVRFANQAAVVVLAATALAVSGGHGIG